MGQDDEREKNAEQGSDGAEKRPRRLEDTGMNLARFDQGTSPRAPGKNAPESATAAKISASTGTRLILWAQIQGTRA